MQTTSERRSELQNNYYFLCECKRCITNYEQNFVNSMICGNSDCQAAVPMKNKHKEACFILINLLIKKYENIYIFAQFLDFGFN
jgi:hypothetical protein